MRKTILQFAAIIFVAKTGWTQTSYCNMPDLVRSGHKGKIKMIREDIYKDVRKTGDQWRGRDSVHVIVFNHYDDKGFLTRTEHMLGFDEVLNPVKVTHRHHIDDTSMSVTDYVHDKLVSEGTITSQSPYTLTMTATEYADSYITVLYNSFDDHYRLTRYVRTFYDLNKKFDSADTLNASYKENGNIKRETGYRANSDGQRVEIDNSYTTIKRDPKRNPALVLFEDHVGEQKELIHYKYVYYND